MRLKVFGVLVIVSSIATGSCKKKNADTANNCFPETPTVRTIANAEATIELLGGEFFIVEKNTVDTKLYPCNLAPEFKIDKLSVRITGEVKSTFRNGNGPCCTDNFVILKISK